MGKRRQKIGELYGEGTPKIFRQTDGFPVMGRREFGVAKGRKIPFRTKEEGRA